MKTVIEMALDTGFDTDDETTLASLERFAELVRADERNSWPAEMEAMERQVNILTDALAQAKAEEREACASLRKEVELVGKWPTEYEDGFWDALEKYEDTIKARSSQ